MDLDAFIAQQVDYYQARAEEYDDWWERRERYDWGPEFNRAWRNDIADLRTWLGSQEPKGDILEVAAGTGTWTKVLAAGACTVTAMDSSPAMLRINRAKLSATEVDYVVADVFDWDPARQYDLVFSAFWISHVPAERWEKYWATLRNALRPGGRALFFESAHPRYAAEHGPAVSRQEPARTPSVGAPAGLIKRRLRDGSEYLVHKRYWRPGELEDALRGIGWDATVGETTFAFLYGSARPL